MCTKEKPFNCAKCNKSSENNDTDKEIFAKFEKQTGIKVNVVKASADELIVKMEYNYMTRLRGLTGKRGGAC